MSICRAFSQQVKIDKIYSPDEIEYIIDHYVDLENIVKDNKRNEYYNFPCSFDIETSSFIRLIGNSEEEKIGIMYEWTFGINGICIIGRTWKEFIDMLNKISILLNLYEKRLLVIYVHNLSYEFQFMRRYIKWNKVFALKDRKPVYAESESGIVFKCSYFLSGYSLQKVGENLMKYDIKKLVGDLDYSLVRSSDTLLTDNEIKYCINDVKVVMCFIQEKIESDGDITKIPLTKTGYVRKYCRDSCLYEGSHKKNYAKYKNYMRLMHSLSLSEDEYSQLKRAFQGGFTHSNPFKSDKVIDNVGSYDFTSSYPAVIVSEKFPMSKGERININTINEFNKNINIYCCMFDAEFINIQSKIYIDSPISASRCANAKNAVLNNGRIVSADYIKTTITEQDYKIFKEFYTWDDMRISNFIRYEKAYLPTDFIKSILKLYADKTKLKGISGKEIEYSHGKEMLNSAYGMMVTDICRDTITYGEDWKIERQDISDSIKRYNLSKNRFLSYPWGVWVTAYARMNLFTGIYQFGNDYVYSDTDSIKSENCIKHIDYINKYNECIINKLEKAICFHGLEESDFKPKNSRGEEKILGIWDYEGEYTRFKTLGAKRYMTEKDGKISITVSGLNKTICMDYINSLNIDPFMFFENDMYIPPKFTGKNTHTYIDDEKKGIYIDYLGNEFEYSQLSAIHLSESEYSLSLSDNYIKYIQGLRVSD